MLNAANEVAVQAFLDEKIGFLDIARINESTLNTVDFKVCSTLEDYMESDAEARSVAEGLC